MLCSPLATGRGRWSGAGGSTAARHCLPPARPASALPRSGTDWSLSLLWLRVAMTSGQALQPGVPRPPWQGAGTLRPPATGQLNHTHPIQGPDLQPKGTWLREVALVCLGAPAGQKHGCRQDSLAVGPGLGHHCHGTACPASLVPLACSPLFPWDPRPPRPWGSPGILPRASPDSPSSRTLTNFDLRLRVSQSRL